MAKHTGYNFQRPGKVYICKTLRDTNLRAEPLGRRFLAASVNEAEKAERQRAACFT